jgi:hypothetical protein
MKTYKDVLPAGCVLLPQNPQLSAGFMIDSNVMSQSSTAPGTLKNGNNVAVATAAGFTTVKRTKTKKPLALH